MAWPVMAGAILERARPTLFGHGLGPGLGAFTDSCTMINHLDTLDAFPARTLGIRFGCCPQTQASKGGRTVGVTGRQRETRHDPFRHTMPRRYPHEAQCKTELCRSGRMQEG